MNQRIVRLYLRKRKISRLTANYKNQSKFFNRNDSRFKMERTHNNNICHHSKKAAYLLLNAKQTALNIFVLRWSL